MDSGLRQWGSVGPSEAVQWDGCPTERLGARWRGGPLDNLCFGPRSDVVVDNFDRYAGTLEFDVDVGSLIV